MNFFDQTLYSTKSHIRFQPTQNEVRYLFDTGTFDSVYWLNVNNRYPNKTVYVPLIAVPRCN